MTSVLSIGKASLVIAATACVVSADVDELADAEKNDIQSFSQMSLQPNNDASNVVTAMQEGHKVKSHIKN